MAPTTTPPAGTRLRRGADLMTDWRGTPVTAGCRVYYPRRWDHSVEMCEGTARDVTPCGQVLIELSRTSRPETRETANGALRLVHSGVRQRRVHAVPPHSITVLTDQPRTPPPGSGPGDTDSRERAAVLELHEGCMAFGDSWPGADVVHLVERLFLALGLPYKAPGGATDDDTEE
ncbi:hypothetical protein [Streptomyces nanshensis]|uniref:Uncharacterized protein n=1 Tax=Streptomyces nanshensis TaxID=518642 RepID=A0A1E7LAG8_9ACTN|nr:hypothetical protein [Streptomyces nanshensis]OEV13242.1 hypothetical protein AN218_04495 [Streptomyces nanshensis]